MPWQQPFPPQEDDYVVVEDPFRWPFMKFEGLRPEDLFGNLHDRFNTTPISILDREAWHADVVALARESVTIEEFYTKLEKRKMTRLNEFRVAIDSIRTLKWSCWPGLPHHRLGRALQKLHLNATVFDAQQAFEAMSSFIEDRLQEFDQAQAREVSRTECSPHSSSRSNEGHGMEASTEVSTNSTDISSPPSHCPPVSPFGQPQLCMNSSRKVQKKRKCDDSEVVGNRGKKPWAATPQSSSSGNTNPEACPSSASKRRHTLNDDYEKHIGSPDGSKHTMLYSSDAKTGSRKASGESTILEHSRTKQDMGQAQIERVAETEEAASASMEAIDSRIVAGALDTANDLFASSYEKPAMCETQYPSTRPNYDILGWHRDYGSCHKALPGGEQHDGSNAAETCGDCGKPVLK